MQRSESIAALAKALSAFQGEIRAVPRSEENPFFHSRYAGLGAIWDAIRRPLATNGLAVCQFPRVEADHVIVTTLVTHTSGEWVSEDLALMPMRERKDVGWVPSMDPQSVGSAITYARRYGLCPALGVVADDDDDAEGAMGRSEGSPGARMPQAMATAPKGLCPVHHVAFVHRQGTGREGKSYDFWSCPQKMGDDYCKERPKQDSPGATSPVEHTGAAAGTTPIHKETVQPPPSSAAQSPISLPPSAVAPTMTINEFWAAWRADQSLPQGSAGTSLLQQVVGRPLAKNWEVGLDLADVLAQARAEKAQP